MIKTFKKPAFDAADLGKQRSVVRGTQFPTMGLEGHSIDDPPEVCPACGKDNSTNDGKWVCEEAKGFCSTACQAAYIAEQVAITEQFVKELAEEEKLIEEYNAKCPKCKGSNRKLCPHQ